MRRNVSGGYLFWAVALTGVAAAGCGGDRQPADGVDTQSAAPAETPARASVPNVPAEPTPQMIARGDSVFHGRGTTGICSTCHAQNGEGGAMAPNLTDDEWLNIDGSMQGIADVIVSGVDIPKQHPATMPPMGGSDLSQEDLIAVAGYVYSLSRR